MGKHLNFTERECLHRWLEEGKKRVEVARLLGRHKSVVTRELQRNSGKRGYEPEEAQQLAETRRQTPRRAAKVDEPEMRAYVEERLSKQWSPDQIAGRLRHERPRQPHRHVSHQAIYNWIDVRAPQWRGMLRRGGRPVERRGKPRDLVRIACRPQVINRRRRYGDWEGDTLVGKGRRNALVTLVERKSGYTRIGRADDLTAESTSRVTTRRLCTLPRALRRSITFDNGKEFMGHRKIARQLQLDIYFADPYRSWQRGTNENTNGLLRQYFPKGTDFSRISHHEVARVEQLLNERPRKRHGYRTPLEVLQEQTVAFGR